MIDVGSTYFKLSSNAGIKHYFRDFSRTIYSDLLDKGAELIHRFKPEDVHICSSANGGLSTLIIGLTKSFSLTFAKNIAYNSGINIIDTVLYYAIDSTPAPGELLDVVIIVGGINSNGGIFDQKLLGYLSKLQYSNIVYVGSSGDAEFIRENVESVIILDNIIDQKLQMQEAELKDYLTNLYHKDIMGKEDIKQLYEFTAHQIYPTPYVVNCALPHIHAGYAAVSPYIVLDVGGATTDIHYSTDLIKDRILHENEFDRLVFKKLGVYKSRESLIHAAKKNEFVYELLHCLHVTEHIFEESSEQAIKILMQISIFLVMCKVSRLSDEYITLSLERLNSIVLTGGITKVLSVKDSEQILSFFYKKVLNMHTIPVVVMDANYDIWTLGMNHTKGEAHVD